MTDASPPEKPKLVSVVERSSSHDGVASVLLYGLGLYVASWATSHWAMLLPGAALFLLGRAARTKLVTEDCGACGTRVTVGSLECRRCKALFRR